MAGQWDALVLDDYEAVMPLTWRKKWGIKYLYQPAFTQQLGIFFSGDYEEKLLRLFLAEVLVHFKFVEINLNYSNEVSGTTGITKRTNFILPLNRKYEDLQQDYPGFTIKHLKRAGKANLKYEFTADYLAVLKLYKKLYAERLPHLTHDDYYNFSAVCKKLSDENNLVVRRVLNAAGELLAAGVFLLDKNRLYNMSSCITREGKKLQANYFLFDQLIREFSNSKFLLDFEGSDIQGIADFYNHFIPQNQPYPSWRINNLSPIAKLFKK